MSQSTRLIIPAPIEIKRETGIIWYEMHVDAEKLFASIEACVDKEKRLGRATLQSHGKGNFTMLINEGDLEIKMLGNVRRNEKGKTEVAGTINGLEFIAGDDSLRPSGLREEERQIVLRWAQLGDSCISVAHALRQSWGQGACTALLIGTAVLAGGCAYEPSFAICGGAVVAGATFLGEC